MMINYWNNFFKIALLLASYGLNCDYAQNINQNVEVEDIKLNLTYDQKSLSFILSDIAKLKKINLLVPQGTNLSEKITINYGIVNINEAWNYILLMLDIFGYTIIKNGDVHVVTLTKKINQEPLPSYFRVKPDQLPDSEDRIRYIYYFENINIVDKNSNLYKNIDAFLKSFFTVNDYGIVDLNNNTLTITGKAYYIKSALEIIAHLDSAGVQEDVAIIPIKNATATTIEAVLKQLVPPKDSNPYGMSSSQPKFGYHFSEGTRIVPLPRSNSIIILGSRDSILRIKDFIEKYLDKPLDTGKSIIHVKELNFMEASELADTLSKLIKNSANASGEQSESARLQNTLSRSVITAEPKYQGTQTFGNQQGTNVINPQPPALGGNNLIVAASHDDWVTIEALIDELDVPQMQVAIEALVVDLSLSDNRIIANQLRNPTIGVPQDFNWQSAQLNKPWLNFIPPDGDYTSSTSTAVINTGRGIAADLLQLTNPKNIFGSDSKIPNPTNLAILAEPGSTVLSYNDGNGIASIMQILDNYGNASILSQPFLIAKDNKTAETKFEQMRIVPGSPQQQSTGGPAIIPYDHIYATLQIQITPRISRSNNINLTVVVTANDFAVATDLNDNTINARQIATNANVGDKEVLVIGGLTKELKQIDTVGVPILSSIPIVGYLFKRARKTVNKSTLIVFIQPTIIKPRLSGGMNQQTINKISYTNDKLAEHDTSLNSVPFENLKDPITRFFLTPTGPETTREINEFTSTGVFSNIKNTDCYKTSACKLEPCCDKAEQIKELTRGMCNPLI